MSKNIKVIDHKGIEYRNEKEMREAYGISRQLYIFRKKKGYTQEECLSPAGSFLHEQHNKGPLLTFTVNGEEYAGLQSLADKYGVSVSWISFIKSRFDNDIGKTIEYFEKRSKNIKIRETRRKRLDKQPVCTKDISRHVQGLRDQIQDVSELPASWNDHGRIHKILPQ